MPPLHAHLWCLSLLSLLSRSNQQELKLLQINHPPHQSSTTEFLLNIEINQVDPNDPVWHRPQAVFQICIEIVQHDFFFRKFTAGETASNCWNNIDPQTFFPLQPPTVELLIYDNYTINAKVSSLADQQLSVSTSTFSYAIGEECQNKLNSALGVVQVEYNTGDSLNDPYHKHHLSPLCLTNDDVTYLAKQKIGLGPYISTSSGFRGTFGVDHTSQEFGHGDTMMLHYILSLYSGDLNSGHFVELGCCAGVTSLTLGVAASLRGTKDAPLHFHSYDIIDMRPENVKRTWLPSMHHHILDVDACHQNNAIDGNCTDLFQILSNASLMMVDHDHATRLAAAVRFGRLLNPTQTATLIVHDFPAGNTIQEWQHAMAKVGYELVHENMRSMFVSTLACFRRRVT
jgi:hypothetical protein